MNTARARALQDMEYALQRALDGRQTAWSSTDFQTVKLVELVPTPRKIGRITLPDGHPRIRIEVTDYHGTTYDIRPLYETDVLILQPSFSTLVRCTPTPDLTAWYMETL